MLISRLAPTWLIIYQQQFVWHKHFIVSIFSTTSTTVLGFCTEQEGTVKKNTLFFRLHFCKFGFHLTWIGCKFSPFLTMAKMDVMSWSNFYSILWNLLQEYKYFARCNRAFFEHFFSISKLFCFAFVNWYAIFGIYLPLKTILFRFLILTPFWIWWPSVRLALCLIIEPFTFFT